MGKIKGLSSWNRWIDSQTEEVKKEVKTVVNETALDIQADAKFLVPIDTHRLQESISVDFDEYEATIGTNVEYSIYVEYGTKYKSARPYMTPAYKKNIEVYKKRLKQALSKVGD